MATRNEQIQAILNEKGSHKEKTEKIDTLFPTAARGCERSYSQEHQTDTSCPNGASTRTTVTITNCPNPSDNQVVVGNWICD